MTLFITLRLVRAVGRANQATRFYTLRFSLYSIGTPTRHGHQSTMPSKSYADTTRKHLSTSTLPQLAILKAKPERVDELIDSQYIIDHILMFRLEIRCFNKVFRQVITAGERQAGKRVDSVTRDRKDPCTICVWGEVSQANIIEN